MPGQLDPGLKVPGVIAPMCKNIGTEGGDCGDGLLCRIYDTTTGRCQGCSPCNPLGMACTDSSQCAVSPASQCYDGMCRELCVLSAPMCSAGKCTNIGNSVAGICL
jgi:hypothetical protein